MRPGCHLAALARLFGTWTRRSTRLQEAFSWREQLVARCNPDFSRVKEIRKTKASVREKELQSRKESQKSTSQSMLCSRIQIKNAVAVLKQARTLNVQVNCCKQSISSNSSVKSPCVQVADPAGYRRHLSGRMFYLFAG